MRGRIDAAGGRRKWNNGLRSKFRLLLGTAGIMSAVATAGGDSFAGNLSGTVLDDLAAKLNYEIESNAGKRVKYLLGRDADPNRAPPGSCSPMQTAVVTGDTGMVRIMMENGGDVNGPAIDMMLFPLFCLDCPEFSGDTVSLLMLASHQGNLPVVSLLIDKGARMEDTANGLTALDIAARNNQSAVLEKLLAISPRITRDELTRMADVACRNGSFAVIDLLRRKGVTPDPYALCKGLADAGVEGTMEAVKRFISLGAALQPEKPAFYTPLTRAAYRGRKEVVSLLLERGADIDAVDDEGKTALMHAASQGHRDLTQMLLDRGARTDVTDKNGRNVLFYARTELLSPLIARKAEIDAVDREKVTPLLAACRNERWDQVRILMEAGANVNHQAPDGGTAVRYAVCHDKFDIARMLVQRKANLNVQPKDLPALHCAVHRYSGKTSIADLEYLLRNGADISLRSRQGATAADHAVQKGEWEKLSLLIRYGAKVDVAAVSFHLVKWASYANDREALALFIRSGCAVDAAGKRENGMSGFDKTKGEPVLVHAIRDYRVDAAELLLEQGASPDVMTADSIPVLLEAIRTYHIEAAGMLARHGADLACTDKKGKGVKEYLTAYPYPELGKLFAARGAQ